MTVRPGLRRTLLACVLSNVVMGAVGLTALGQSPTTHLASNCAPASTCHVDKRAQNADTSTTATPSTTLASAAPAAGANTTSSTARVRTRPSTSTAAVAVDDVTGIASSTAPQTPARVAPTTGTYPVTFKGTASVDGKAQSVPSSGSITFTKSGGNVVQESPDAPGDVVLVQRYSANESSLVSIEMTANKTTKTFVPASPVSYLQYNSPAGTGWSWEATSTDGKTKVQATASVGAMASVVINGETVSLVQQTTTLTMSGDINGTAKLITWASPAHRLPVIQRQVINATAKVSWSSVKLVSDVTTTFSRLTPN